MPGAVTRVFRLFRLLRARRAAQNSVNGAPTNLRPGEMAFGDAEERLYVAKGNGELVTFNPYGGGGATGPAGPTGPVGPAGPQGPAGSSLPAVVSLSYAATLNTDASSGDIFDVTLTGNATLANPTNPVGGKTLRWRITQDATGGRTVTLGDKFVIPTSATSPLPFSTAANKMDVLAATYHAGRDKWDIIAFVMGY